MDQINTEARPATAEDIASSLADMFDNYPMGDPGDPLTTMAFTGPDGKTHTVTADPEQLGWFADLITAGHADADRSHYDHPDHRVCAHCEQARPIPGVPETDDEG
ncbi:hypothetical protein [Nocardiopsis tropica]|uniref:Uncharacterized protein n=1 Tax=Nocardiopsis tropica TaxID=109330 RepID=A0ABU7KS59_9ACTN|nr:hypothetical protein [Nocardiopsis umidischolae]MEE2051824.1 hypothetical protein [Nocardiopsis umidischolae]